MLYPDAISAFIHHWQTLIAGLLALIGAGATVYMMRKQIRAMTQESRDLRERKLLAARAVMPADLSEICAYTERCAALIDEALHYYDEHREPPPNLKAPTLPERVPANLQSLIEQFDDGNAHAVADLISCYQVQRARLQGALRDWSGDNNRRAVMVFTLENIEHPLIETIHLRILANSMFDFARRNTGTISRFEIPTNHQFNTAIGELMGVGFPFTENDRELISRMKISLGMTDAT